VGSSLLDEKQLYENVYCAILSIIAFRWPIGIKAIASVRLKSTQGKPYEIYKFSDWFAG